MKLLRKLRALFRRNKLDAEMAEEMRAHLELQAEQNIARGMNPDEARYAARRQFGGVEQIKERARDQRGWLWLEHVNQDLRYGFRQLRRSPGFAAIAVLSLALGIGVSVTAFSLVNAAALRPLPGVKDPERLVYRNPLRGGGISYPEYEYCRDHTQVFSGLAASTSCHATPFLIDPNGPSADGEAEGYLRSLWLVSGNYFSVLGVEMAIGRGFLPDEDRASAAQPVLVLSYGYWSGRFHSDPKIVGKTLLVNRIAFTVVGVARRAFTSEPGVTNPPWAWAPLATLPVLEPGRDRRRAHEEIDFHFFGRMKPEANFDQAVAELRLLDAQYAREFLRPEPHRVARAPLADDGFVFFPWRMPEVKMTMMALLVAMSVVLLVACANLANLLLARATTRQREISVRLALGASRGRIVRQLLTESMMIACVGGGVGLLLAAPAGELLWPAVLRLNLTPELRQLFGVDGRMVAYAMAVSLATGLAFGLLPALEAARASIHSALKQEATVLGHHISRARLRKFLVIAQVAVCVSLLIAATLVVRTAWHQGVPDLTFATEGVYYATPSAPRGSKAAQRPQDFELAVVERLRALPEVRAVTVADIWNANFVTAESIDAAATTSHVAKGWSGRESRVQADYFSTLALPFVRGRNFTTDEIATDAPVFIVSETLARQLWPGEEPLGRRIKTIDPVAERLHVGERQREGEIIGVVKDGVGAVRDRWNNGAYGGDLYSPLPPIRSGFAEIWIRAQGNLAHLMRTAPEQARLANPEVHVEFVGQLSYMFDEWRHRMLMVSGTVAVLGTLTLLLAALGVYGVMAYAVAQRTHEIGVRMAMGAERATIQRMVLGEGGRLVAWGVALGALGCAIVSWLARSFLYGLSPVDPVAFGGISLLLGAVALAACWFPARAATKVDPMVALRCE
jgi:predicted permease